MSIDEIDETYSSGGRNHTDDDGPMVMIVDGNECVRRGDVVLFPNVFLIMQSTASFGGMQSTVGRSDAVQAAQQLCDSETIHKQKRIRPERV